MQKTLLFWLSLPIEPDGSLLALFVSESSAAPRCFDYHESVW